LQDFLNSQNRKSSSFLETSKAARLGSAPASFQSALSPAIEIAR